MKMLKYNILLALLAMFFFSSCDRGDKNVNFFNGQQKKIDFSEEYSLKGEKISTDTIGIGYAQVYGPKDFLSFNIIKEKYPYLWIKDYTF